MRTLTFEGHSRHGASSSEQVRSRRARYTGCMDKPPNNTTLAACREALQRRIKRQFLQSLTPAQLEMYAATTTPMPSRRVERALANLIAALDIEFPQDDRG